MWIIKYKKIFFGISITLVVLSIVSLFVFTPRASIEFTGGSNLVLSVSGDVPEPRDVALYIKEMGISSVLVQPIGEDGLSIKTSPIDESQKESIVSFISETSSSVVTIDSFTTIGPSIGREMLQKSWYSLVLVILSIVLYIAYTFRKVSVEENSKQKGISSWKYGLTANICLLHDVIVTTGFYVLLSVFFGAEIDTLFVVAILTVLGVSVNDTIVVFDRIRENLLKDREEKGSKTFENIVGKSIDETIARSINTSLTVVLVLLALVLFGPETTKIFSITMMVGMIVGTFSSIFLASPLLVVWEKMQFKKAVKK